MNVRKRRGATREIPRPAPESAGLRDDPVGWWMASYRLRRLSLMDGVIPTGAVFRAQEEPALS